MRKAIYSPEHKYLVEQLKKARLEAGLSQIEAAKRLKCTQSQLSKIESGQRRIDLVQLKEFANLYRKSISHFLRAIGKEG
jgi:transcriptional regulator with XRE-family HTH domain